MVSYLVKRLAQALISLLGVSLIVFAITHLIGDPDVLLLPAEASQEDRAVYRQALGLDKPAMQQYLIFLSKAVTGDFGESYRFHTPVLDLVLGRLPPTIELALAAMTFAIIFGVSSGIISAVWPGRWIDRLVQGAALLGMAAPTFWVGIMLILLFSVQFQIFPIAGRSGFASLILPAITLGWYSTAVISRMTRSTMLDVLDSDYIRMSILKGTPRHVIIFKHGMKNILNTMITVVSLQLIVLLAGAVITETIFSWPGIGRLLIQSAAGGDYPVVQGITLISSALFVLINLGTDLLYFAIDPRIRSSE
jgi:peptide/nickel transport system permease protein